MLGAHGQEAGSSLAVIDGQSQRLGSAHTATQHLKSACLPLHLKLPLINGAESLINENQLSCAYRYLCRLNN